jgi:hypothetical protein
MKSISYIVERHSGHLSITQNEDRFMLDIIFPQAEG